MLATKNCFSTQKLMEKKKTKIRMKQGWKHMYRSSWSD